MFFAFGLRGSELSMSVGSMPRCIYPYRSHSSPHRITDFYRTLPTFYRSFGLSWENSILDTRVSSTCNHLGLSARLITSFSISSMVSLQHARVFFRGFLGSRNYKIQIVARVGRKSAVVPSGVTEASCSRFFTGLDFDRSRGQNSPDKETGVGSLHDPRGYDGRLPLGAGYYLDLVLPRFEEPRKKIGSRVRLLHGRL